MNLFFETFSSMESGDKIRLLCLCSPSDVRYLCGKFFVEHRHFTQLAIRTGIKVTKKKIGLFTPPTPLQPPPPVQTERVLREVVVGRSWLQTIDSTLLDSTLE